MGETLPENESQSQICGSPQEAGFRPIMGGSVLRRSPLALALVAIALALGSPGSSAP